MVEFEKKLNENKSECRTARMFVYHEWRDARAMRCEDTTQDYDINSVIQSQPVLDLFGIGGSQPPSFHWPLEKVKISQKYIADPPLVYPQIEYWSQPLSSYRHFRQFSRDFGCHLAISQQRLAFLGNCLAFAPYLS